MGTVITIARLLGSGGSEVAIRVAERLSFRYLDREILHKAADIVGFPDERMLEKLEDKEHRHTVIQRVFEAMQHVPPIGPIATLREYGPDGSYTLTMNRRDSETMARSLEAASTERAREQAANGYRGLVEQAIGELAQDGDAVIVGRGGQFVLRDLPGILHVLVVAPQTTRVERVARRLDIDETAARRLIHASDSERKAYMRQFDGTDWLDTDLYDLVINTGRVPVALAVNLVCSAARKM